MPIEKYIANPYHELDLWGKHVTTKLTFVYQLLKKMKNGYSPIVGICGCQRIGKSFVAVWLARLLYTIQDKPFNPTQNTYYEPEKAIMDLGTKNREAIIIDEAGDVMDYQEWYKQAHRALRSMINTQAYKNNLYIFISPFTAQIDKSIRIHWDFIIRVKSRGNFLVWKYAKKYDADKINEATYRVFLDSVSIKMSVVPKDIWKDYLSFSQNKKEEIRIRRLENKKDSSAFDTEEAHNLTTTTKDAPIRKEIWNL